MSSPLSALEIARDEVSNAVARWITAATEGGEESAITDFDAALAAFEAAVVADFLYTRFRITLKQIKANAEAPDVDLGSAR